MLVRSPLEIVLRPPILPSHSIPPRCPIAQRQRGQGEADQDTRCGVVHNVAVNVRNRLGVATVTWPKELKQLDEDLVAGRLSPQEYLRRRDELLHVDARPLAGSPPTDDVTPRAASRDPFPPPFRWERSSDEPTDVFLPVAAHQQANSSTDTPDTTTRDTTTRDTTAPDSTAPDSTQVVRGDNEEDSERTQVVPQVKPFNSVVARLHHVTDGRDEESDLKQEASGGHGDASMPPWVVPQPPPLTPILSPSPSDPPARQEPDFLATTTQHRTKPMVGIAVLVLLLLGLIASALGYFLSQDLPNEATSTGQAQQPQPAPAPATTTTTTTTEEPPTPSPPSPEPATTSDAVIEPPGQPRQGGGTFGLARVRTDALVSPAVATALGRADMTEGVLKTTTRGDTTIAVFAFAVRDEQAATEVVESIVTEQRDGGLGDDNSRTLPGVTVLGTPEATDGTVYYRAVYVLYGHAILIEVSGPDRTAVLVNFDSVLDRQLTHAPPTVR